ncbi:hypothetical protein Q3G72_034841 [Acer saccharum]|nr:hypothetical protein Q3G72_034841 [Acer saccharum]
MSDSEFTEDPWTASYGVPEAFPSPAAIEFQSHTLQDFSSFLGSSSPHQRVDISLLQLYQSQPQYEELAFWEYNAIESSAISGILSSFSCPPSPSTRKDRELPGHGLALQFRSKAGQTLLKQLLNNEASGSYHSHLPQEYPKIIETRLQQTNMEALGRQHFPLPQLQLRIDEELQLQLQAIMEASQRQHSQLSQQQQLWFNEPPLQENRHEVPPPGSDITLNTGMESKIVWNAITDINCALQACSPPGTDIHWPYGEMDKPLFDIPFFSGKIDSSSLPDNREMDQRLNIIHQPMFRIPFYSGKIGSSSLPAPVIDLYPEPSAHDSKPRRRGPDKLKRKPQGSEEAVNLKRESFNLSLHSCK